MNKEQIEAILESLLRRLCNGVIAYTDNLEIVKTYTGASLTKYNLRAHAADAPRLIGKNAERFKALRFVMASAGNKLGRPCVLETLLPSVIGAPEPWPKFRYNPRWPKVEIQKLLEDTLQAVYKYPPIKIQLSEAMGAAIFQVILDPREILLLVEESSPIMQSLFKGIGVTNGVQLSIDIGTEKN